MSFEQGFQPQFTPHGDLIPYMGFTSQGDGIPYHGTTPKGDAIPPEMMRSTPKGDAIPFMGTAPNGDLIPYPVPPGGNPYSNPFGVEAQMALQQQNAQNYAAFRAGQQAIADSQETQVDHESPEDEERSRILRSVWQKSAKADLVARIVDGDQYHESPENTALLQAYLRSDELSFTAFAKKFRKNFSTPPVDNLDSSPETSAKAQPELLQDDGQKNDDTISTSGQDSGFAIKQAESTPSDDSITSWQQFMATNDGEVVLKPDSEERSTDDTLVQTDQKEQQLGRSNSQQFAAEGNTLSEAEIVRLSERFGIDPSFLDDEPARFSRNMRPTGAMSRQQQRLNRSEATRSIPVEFEPDPADFVTSSLRQRLRQLFK